MHALVQLQCNWVVRATEASSRVVHSGCYVGLHALSFSQPHPMKSFVGFLRHRWGLMSLEALLCIVHLGWWGAFERLGSRFEIGEVWPRLHRLHHTPGCTGVPQRVRTTPWGRARYLICWIRYIRDSGMSVRWGKLFQTARAFSCHSTSLETGKWCDIPLSCVT